MFRKQQPPAMRTIATLALMVSSLLAGLWPKPLPAAQPGPIEPFIDEMVSRHSMDRALLEQSFARVTLRQDILDAISNPAEAKPWHRYRPIFVTQTRIGEGAKFWNEHRELLDRVSAQYGVPPQILVGIVGVETRYGRHRGGYSVLDSLYTLAFAYPPRARFFRSELEQFLLLAQEEQLDLNDTVGSYAGAMGQPQFISSSYRRYAVDFDGDGKRDLFGNIGDVLGSVANYFVRHGWKSGAPIAVPTEVTGTAYQKVLTDGLKPISRLGALADAGVRVPEGMDPDTPAKLLEFDTEEGKEYWIGFDNFYVITRYNHSALYAMAVFQLGNAVREMVAKP